MSSIISKKFNAVFNNNRPTIGILIESLSGSYQSGIWPGIMDVAKSEDINVVCFTGGAYGVAPDEDDPWEIQRNVMYDIAEKSSLDGLIISGTLCSYVNSEEKQKFLDRFSHLPSVSLVPLSENIPSVAVDNQEGMKQLMNHLVKIHNYKRFAFVSGPVGNNEADERLNFVNNYLSENHIEFSLENVVTGEFTRDSGVRAISKLMSENGTLDYDVIICCDDETAYGAIEELRNRGYIVPEDIAVVGFDDDAESKYITPPLTTVAQPLKELGKKACSLLIEQMKNSEVSFATLLDANITIRQSCGCFDQKVPKNYIKKSLMEATSANGQIDSNKLKTVLIDKLSKNTKFSDFALIEISDICTSFCSDINTLSSDNFLKNIDRIGRSKILLGSNLNKWNKLFTKMWEYILSHLDRETFSFADALLHKARIIRGNLALRAQGHRRIIDRREYVTTHEVGETISNTLKLPLLLDVIANELPDLGIDTFYISLYDNPESHKDNMRLVLRVEGGIIFEVDDVYYNESDLLPKDHIITTDSHTVITEPLYFHEEHFGTIYFLLDENPNGCDLNLFEVLGTYISNALHSRYLISKVQGQATTLKKQNEELEKLREQEHSYLTAIKSELELGRNIQRSFLPKDIFQPDGYSIAVDFTPAREVSGDFYDIYPLNENEVFLIISDVSGKDVSAALFASLVKTLLKVFGDFAFQQGESPLTAIETVNNYVIRNHRQPKGRCMFATLICAVLNTDTGDISYVNGGHNPAMIISDGEVKYNLKPTGPALGLADGLKFEIKETHIGKGDTLLAYTDGVTEAQNSNDEMFGLDKLTEYLINNNGNSAQDTITFINDKLVDFTKGMVPFDDITMIALQRDV